MEKREDELSKESGKLRQFLAAMIVNLSAMSYGTMIGWQSPSAPQLQSSSPPVGSVPMTDDGVSWLSGSMCLAGTLTVAILLMIPNKFSRKRMCYGLTLPLAFSWLFIIFATNHTHIYVARGLSGIGGAGVLFFVPIYVSEIAGDSIRGFLASVMTLVLNFGILLAYILGGVLSMRVLAITLLAIPVLYLVAFVFMPESPVYLVRQNRLHEAARSLNWLKAGNNLAVEKTLSHLQLEIKESAIARSAKLSDLFKDRATIKALIISLMLFCGQQFGGIFALISYSETIFKMSGSSLTPNTSAIIIALIQFFGSWLALVLVERAGRRLLLLVSASGMCACHCAMGAFFYFQDQEYNVSAFFWVPVTALSIFMVVYSMGLGTIPVVVVSEIFSRDVTSLGLAMGMLMCWMCAFIMVKVFSDLIVLLGTYGCFFLLAIVCVCNLIFCFIMMPETKGRLREDIVDELNGKSKTKQIKHIVAMDSEQVAHV
ncbi:hypothetical protein DMN91_003297 [Ooceraea biroi]|uniref:Facilitated trehalose transporter Tret1 n=1 Tax=Ooceraea biroi TaxID=2015173 RepID=A0A026WMM0_OOCBI|nr:facilitated trehalose transporter Tret1 [Ooceraea biroi]EZA57322.1 Facilitated trehalose transporter Tret1 [Ooceraea biroi]RLU25205.1 hypothetical protein DMN91_003297 [Ooceraea biroi]